MFSHLTEKVGFEPTAPFGVTGFQDRLLKPLGHLSKNSALIFYHALFCLSSTFFIFLIFVFFALLYLSATKHILSEYYLFVNSFFHFFYFFIFLFIFPYFSMVYANYIYIVFIVSRNFYYFIFFFFFSTIHIFIIRYYTIIYFPFVYTRGLLSTSSHRVFLLSSNHLHTAYSFPLKNISSNYTNIFSYFK